MDAEEARAFLRQMTDNLIGMVGQLQEAQRNDAAIQTVARIQGAGFALSAAAGMPPEAIQETALAAAEVLSDLGYLDRARANWWGAQSESRFAVPPEQSQQVPTSGASVPAPRLVRVVRLGNVEVGPDHAGAVTVFTSLELYEDRVLTHFSRLGGDPAQDDPTRDRVQSWPARDSTGLELRCGGSTFSGELPFQRGTIVWVSAPAEDATSLLITVPIASGPEPVMLPLRG
jgi:hypothetical protein